MRENLRHTPQHGDWDSFWPVPLLRQRGLPGWYPGAGNVFLQTENRYIGPGQSGIFNCKGEDGQDLYIFTFHYYDGEDNGKPKLGARYLEWDDDDWPVLVPIRSNWILAIEMIVW